jgi:hypothetical protein
MIDIICKYCDAPIRREEMKYAYQRVKTWVKKREQGGARNMILTEYLNEFAHSYCVDMRKQRGRRRQSTLFK